MGLDHEKLQDEISEKMKKSCVGAMSPPEIQMLPSKCVITERFLYYSNRIRNMEVRSDDIWVITYPKCGTTWTQEMVWLLANEIDFEQAKRRELYDRFPFLELVTLWPTGSDIPDTVAFVENQKSPRFIKSHLPPELLPEQLFKVNPKIIYVTRNPKDAAVSYFHHFQLWNNYTGSKEDFLEAFLDDKMIFSPFWEHVLNFWEMKDKPNILISSFEEMKKDLSSVMKRTAEFLGVTYTDEQRAQLLDHLNFKNMKSNPMVNFENEIKEMGKPNMEFIRKGEVGSGEKEMPPQLVAKFDSWSKEKLKGSDFPSYLNNHNNNNNNNNII